MNEHEMGIFIAGCVDGYGLAVITWTVFHLLIGWIQERQERQVAR